MHASERNQCDEHTKHHPTCLLVDTELKTFFSRVLYAVSFIRQNCKYDRLSSNSAATRLLLLLVLQSGTPEPLSHTWLSLATVKTAAAAGGSAPAPVGLAVVAARLVPLGAASMAAAPVAVAAEAAAVTADLAAVASGRACEAVAVAGDLAAVAPGFEVGFAL